MKRAIVIGGGPAGMMAAIAASQRGRQVLLLEKNKQLGRKLLLTGKGRCNLTNLCDVETMMDAIVTNPRFMYSSLYAFGPEDLISFFQQLGLPTIVERGQRVFPRSEKSQDVKKALEMCLKRLGVEICQGEVAEILLKEDRVLGVRLKDGSKIESDSIVLATGGLSYPATGSTGDGYGMAKSLGHTITPLKPSLVPIRAKESWAEGLDGLKLKNVSFRIESPSKAKIYEGFGEVYFLGRSLSGPLVLTASAIIGEVKGKEYRAVIDLKPALTEKEIYQRAQRDFEKYSNRDLGNALGDLLPQAMIQTFLVLLRVSPKKKVRQLTREERKRAAHLLKNFNVSLKELGPFEEAIITKGGISVEEIQPSTMESKKIKGLFFGGEIIDVDALTGGYNLQLAFSTGYVAGLNC